MKKYTTLNIGGPAQFYRPDNISELQKLLVEFQDAYILGNGSNVLIGDNVSKPIVHTKQCKHYHLNGNSVYMETGCMMPYMTSFLAKQGLGGLEYFSSIPATLGGAIYMNAGRGSGYNLHIGQVVNYVDVLDVTTKETFRLQNKECLFGYRTSVFHKHPEWVILGAEICLATDEPSAIKDRIKQRLEFCRSWQDLEYPNAGTTFSISKGDFNALKGIGIGDAAYSSKTKNWIINKGNATFYDVQKLLDLAPEGSVIEWSIWT